MLMSFSEIRNQITLVLLLLAGFSQNAAGQLIEPVEQPWYVGAGMGTSFGQCTFRSITGSEMHWGFQAGVAGGYRLNRFMSVETGLQFGAQTETAPDGSPYWLSAEGERYVSPVINREGWYYRDIECRTGWTKLSVQANYDVLGQFVGPDYKWSVNVSPQLSLITTKGKFVTPTRDIRNDRQWHMGLGWQLSVGYQITDEIGVAFVCGTTHLTGKNFDDIPESSRNNNSIWDTGIRVTYRLTNK